MTEQEEEKRKHRSALRALNKKGSSSGKLCAWMKIKIEPFFSIHFPVSLSQCESLAIFLPLRFYVKSIFLRISYVQNFEFASTCKFIFGEFSQWNSEPLKLSVSKISKVFSLPKLISCKIQGAGKCLHFCTVVHYYFSLFVLNVDLLR